MIKAIRIIIKSQYKWLRFFLCHFVSLNRRHSGLSENPFRQGKIPLTGIHPDRSADGQDELPADVPDHCSGIGRDTERPYIVVQDLIKRKRAVSFARGAVGAFAENKSRQVAEGAA